MLLVGAGCFTFGLLLMLLPTEDFDAKWRPRIGAKAWPQKKPRVAIDAAHWNGATAEGSYQPFAKLLADDGYSVASYTEEWRLSGLRRFQVLVVVRPLGWSGSFRQLAADLRLPAPPIEQQNPFGSGEIDAAKQYVQSGGRLLLIIDPNSAEASQQLASQFGIGMNPDPAQDRIPPRFTPVAGMLGKHAITREVKCVASSGGQWLTGPAGSTPLLRVERNQVLAVASDYGQGRVVVLGDPGLASARFAGEGAKRIPIGMNQNDCDNLRFVRNLMFWLSEGTR